MNREVVQPKARLSAEINWIMEESEEDSEGQK